MGICYFAFCYRGILNSTRRIGKFSFFVENVALSRFCYRRGEYPFVRDTKEKGIMGRLIKAETLKALPLLTRISDELPASQTA